MLIPWNAIIRVGKLERFIADFDGDMGLIRENLLPKTRGKIAVIGSGPAGLTIAGDLARKGFNVEIFEMEPEPGGVARFQLSKIAMWNPGIIIKSHSL